MFQTCIGEIIQFVSKNMLHFEVQSIKDNRANRRGLVALPSVIPSFVLAFNDDWKDFFYKTMFTLYFYDNDKQRHRIGNTKIMCRGKWNTFEALKDSFDGRLGKEYCSLAEKPSYYSKLYSLFKGSNIVNELLICLRDCAYNHTLYEFFCEDDCFKHSLLREDSSRQAVWEAHFLLSGQDKLAAYSFDVHFAPDYLNGAYTDWHVPVYYDAQPFMRTIGLIGDNGVGKTQMLKILISDLINDGAPVASYPLFRSCLAISSTPFDGYDSITAERLRIPYEHFSIEQNAGVTIDSIVSSIETIKQRPLIHNKPMIRLYKDAVDELLGEQVSGFLTCNKEKRGFELDKEYLSELIPIMSSGQLQILNLLSFIHAHIHLSSLLVIDEPEVHMHPQSIVSFMKMLGTILYRFRSFAVIATHSPLVVREMVGQNVYLMRLLDGGIPNVAKVSFETFGADATELYRNIFNFDERLSSFYQYVKLLADKKSYEQVIALFQRYAPQLSLNARLSVRDFYEDLPDA